MKRDWNSFKNYTIALVACCSDLRLAEGARPKRGGHRRGQGQTRCADFRRRLVSDGCDNHDRDFRANHRQKVLGQTLNSTLGAWCLLIFATGVVECNFR